MTTANALPNRIASCRELRFLGTAGDPGAHAQSTDVLLYSPARSIEQTCSRLVARPLLLSNAVAVLHQIYAATQGDLRARVRLERRRHLRLVVNSDHAERSRA
jgi:hypothetical protein